MKENFFVIAGACLVGIIVITLTVCGEYPERLMDNRYLMLFVLLLFLSGGILYTFIHRKKAAEKVLKHPVLFPALLYAVLFILQLVWVNSVYFYSGWEVVLMRNRVEWIVNGGTMQGMSIDVGYSIYPNNLLIFYILCIIEKIGKLFSMERPYNLCIYVSCLSVNLSCFLGNLIMRKLTRSSVIKCCYTLFSTVFILFSPWIIIPYTDTYGMFFAMLGMWGLLCLDHKYMKWVVVAFASFVGYYVKPTSIFPLFTAYIVYGIKYLCSVRERWKEICALILSTVVFWCVWLLIPLWIQYTYSFELLPECKITPIHYLMMGINEKTSGAYSYEDFEFSCGFPDVESREQANKEEYIRRWNALIRDKKLGEFIKDKALVNFNDGTFAWNGEGSFYWEEPGHDNILWDWFLNTVVPPGTWDNEGACYYLYRTVSQVFWLQMLTGILFVGFGRKDHRTQKACMSVVLCGLMAFVMIFEARARYLFLYTPVFLIFSLCGYEAVWQRFASAFFGIKRYLLTGYTNNAKIKTATKSEKMGQARKKIRLKER